MSDVDFELFNFNTDYTLSDNNSGLIDINFLDENDNLLLMYNDIELFQVDLNTNDYDEQPIDSNKRNHSDSFYTDNFQYNYDSNVQIPLIDKSNIKLFPGQLVNAVNSADTKKIKDLLKSYFNTDCHLYIHLPFKEIEEVGFDTFINSFNNIFTTFPDLICMLKSAKIINGNGQSLIDCKFRCSTTVSKQTLDHFSLLDKRKTINDLLKSYNPNKDLASRRDSTLNALNELNNDGKYVQIYVKMKLRFYIDHSTNCISKFEEIPTLSSCELLQEDFAK